MTYLTTEEWNKYILPKLNDNILFMEELKQIIGIKYILLDIIELLFQQNSNQSKKDSKSKLKKNLLYNSIIYYYKYKLVSDSDFSENKKIICISCIYLAFKESNHSIDLNWLSNKVEPYLNYQVPIKGKFQIQDIHNKIKRIEFELLNSIQFNIGIDNPYLFQKMIKLYLLKIEIENNIIEEAIDLINYYIDKSILFPLFLYYTNYEIALGSILLLKEDKKYNFINIDEIIKLNKFQIDENNIYQCSKYICKICEVLKIKNLEINPQNWYHKNNENNLNFGSISCIEKNN